MPRTAKLFRNGRSLAVRLPAEFRFEGTEAFIRRDDTTGETSFSRGGRNRGSAFSNWWDRADVPEDFLSDRGDQEPQERDLF